MKITIRLRGHGTIYTGEHPVVHTAATEREKGVAITHVRPCSDDLVVSVSGPLSIITTEGDGTLWLGKSSAFPGTTVWSKEAL